ncbi:MAG TPA: hypothetical protein VLI71_05740, partial [Gammaproteobacteria bacterium]|nr:hypothetical protein [Gammaproteobacteria bacterium]
SPPTNRSTTVLGKSELATRADGKQSRVVTVSAREHPEVRKMTSGIIGYFDRTVRMPFCRATAFNLDHPELFEKVVPIAREASELFKRTQPERYAAQAAAAAGAHQAWVIPGTVFSTITVNKNYNAACHLDAGDYRPGFGLMAAIRSGSYTGGITYWPAYRVGARMDSGDLCVADVHEWHGVTDMVGVPGRWERLSLVFYLREKMCRCGSPEHELARAKARKLGMPLYDKDEKPAHGETPEGDAHEGC